MQCGSIPCRVNMLLRSNISIFVEPRTFSVIRCTGYLKTWLPGRIDFDDMESDEINTLSCLVAVGKLQSVSIPTALTAAALKDTRAIEFVWRLTMDGRFSYVDQKQVTALCNNSIP